MTVEGSKAKSATSVDADVSAISALPRRLVHAWENHDADAFSKLFTEDGSMILPGIYKKGRAGIRSFMADAFAGTYRGTRVTGDALDLTFLSDESAVLLTTGGVLAPGETKVSPERAIRASWIVVKRGGEWSLAAYQNSPK